MKTLDKKGRKLVTTWSTLLLGTFLSAGAEASEPSCCQERLSINQQQIHNSNHASHIQQPILLAFEGGRSRPSGVGSRPDGARPDGVGGKRPESLGGSRPEGVGGTRPEGIGGSRPEGVGGSRPEGAGGSRPRWGN